jgi:Leucine-rich repeat (LRR) protein
MLKVKGEYSMKKALIIANILFASATVFGMHQREDDLSHYSMFYGVASNIPSYLPWPPRERENFRPEGVNSLAELTESRPSINSEQLTELFNSLVTPRDSMQDNLNLVVNGLINDSTRNDHNLVGTLMGDLNLIQNHYDAERRLLDLSNQNLTFIPLEVGLFMEDLEELDLSNNRVEDLLVLPASIRKLNISGNNFSRVPLGIFGLESLEELDLSNNNLTSLCSGEIFDFLPRNLKKLNVSGNDLKSLGSLLSFLDLEELTLDGWSLKYIPDDRIESITNIHGVNEGRVDPEYLAKLVVNKKNNLYSGNKLMLQALGGVCTVKLKHP